MQNTMMMAQYDDEENVTVALLLVERNPHQEATSIFAQSSRHYTYSDREHDYPRTHRIGSGPPSPSPSPPLPKPESQSSVGLDMSPSMPSNVDVGTSTRDYWYYSTQTVRDPIHQPPVLSPPPYTSTDASYPYGPSMFEAPTCALTYCSNPAADGCFESGHSQVFCVTVPMVMYTACCQGSILQGYPCIGGLHI
uniref:Uncharacterized protein n=1 Tax=Talaromyces marneffei PM1 TaxID=1077442 RepID=A0A093UXT8_TALMA